MTERRTILAISGSTRTGSSNESILRYLESQYSEVLEFVFYPGLTSLPHFNPDFDSTPPASVVQLRQSISDADGILICTPEYIFALPGALKNLIEWLVSTTIMDGKPTAYIVASGLGERSFESLGVILKTLSAQVSEESKLLIQGARAKMSANAGPKDEQTSQDLDRLMKSLISSLNIQTARSS
ncbi:MAG: NADPH-dependent FMN reductase [Chryseolinea sp.]